MNKQEKTNWNALWPVLKTYKAEYINRIALPLGGIGTGTISLGGRGNLQDWEIMNRPAKGFIPSSGKGLYDPVFCLYTKTKDAAPPQEK